MKKIFFVFYLFVFAGYYSFVSADNQDIAIEQYVKKLHSGLPSELKYRSADQIASDIVRILPKYSEKKDELTKLSQLSLDIASGKSIESFSKSKVSSRATDESSLAIEILKAYLANAGITVDDWDFLQSTLLPLYTYTISNRTPPAQVYQIYKVDTLYRAPKDGCYYGIGDERNTYDPSGLSNAECRECVDNGGRTKINGAYPWGMVTTNNRMFWGTVNNILCMPSWQAMTTLNGNNPYENSCWACEYEYGVRKDAGKSGDMVRPRVYMYNMNSGVVKDVTPANATVLDDCLGLRSAGTHNGVVFIGGPGLDSDQGQTSTKSAFLAFDNDGNFLGESDMSNIDGCKVTDVRRWLVYDDVLYVGVAITDSKGVNKGAILRWYGDKNNPFQFHIVGYTANEAGEICLHNGRIYAGGWPTSNMPYSAVFEGPEIPKGGYTPADATEWPVMWAMTQYEPNAMNLQMEQCSLLHSYKGKLYWSMWYVQYGLPLSLSMLGVDLNTERGMAVALSMLRQATLWRADTDKKDENGKFSAVEMLYGEETLPNYDYMTGEIKMPRLNVSHYKPVYGRAGFDRQFTAYMWSVADYQDHMFIGTMSIEALIEPAMANTGDDKTQSSLSALVNLLDVKEENKGYELYMFLDGNSPAKTVTHNGFGNHMQYGVRNMCVSPSGKYLYLGTASPMNLRSEGGWTVLRYKDSTEYPSSIAEEEIKPASILISKENGYITVSSLNGEEVRQIQVADISGRIIYTDKPVNKNGYLFESEIGHGIFIVSVTTDSGSWTSKISM